MVDPLLPAGPGIRDLWREGRRQMGERLKTEMIAPAQTPSHQYPHGNGTRKKNGCPETLGDTPCGLFFSISPLHFDAPPTSPETLSRRPSHWSPFLSAPKNLHGGGEMMVGHTLDAGWAGLSRTQPIGKGTRAQFPPPWISPFLAWPCFLVPRLFRKCGDLPGSSGPCL